MHHDPDLRGKIGQQRLNGRLRLHLQQNIQRIRRGSALLLRQQMLQHGIFCRLVAHLALPDTLRPMPRDRIEPGRKLRRILQPGQTLKRLHKRLLGHIFRGLTCVQKLPGNHQNCAAKATHQFVISLWAAQLCNSGDFRIAETLQSVLQCHACGSSRHTGDIPLQNG